MARCKAEGCGKIYRRAKGDLRTVWCSPDCGVEISRYRIARSRAKALAAHKAKAVGQKRQASKAVRELNRRTLSWQHKQTQKAFNKLRVLEEIKWFRDRGLSPFCISCGKINMDFCCGHLVTQGSNSRTRYDPLNTYLQCNRYCNMGLSGNRKGNKSTHGYDEGLAIRFGKREAAAIIEHCESQNAPKKWDWEELEAMRTDYLAKIRDLQKS